MRTLGLDADATAEDIRVAYKETAQILHPDRFAGNRKLQDRATEQFKNLQEAYDLLRREEGRAAARGRARGATGASGGAATGGRGASRAGSAGGSDAAGPAAAAAWASAGAARAHVEVDEDGNEVEYVTDAEIRARLAGIAAARVQMVAQRDALIDERRNGAVMAAIGAVLALLTARRPIGILGVIAAAASAATVWGVVQVVSSQRNLTSINAHLAELAEQRREYERLLDE
nr:J domain-containing protein [Adlercreutzia sp. JBNU-10]